MLSAQASMGHPAPVHCLQPPRSCWRITCSAAHRSAVGGGSSTRSVMITTRWTLLVIPVDRYPPVGPSQLGHASYSRCRSSRAGPPRPTPNRRGLGALWRLFQGGQGDVFLGVLGGDVGGAGGGGGLAVAAAERYFLDEYGQHGQDGGEQDGPAEDVGDGRGQGFQDGDADRG